ncbi:10935_t:CDS:2, partial [Ambispora gerdemannii]
MAVTNSLNLRSPAVKRLLQEARELQRDQSIDYVANPLEDNIFEWHFVIRGPDNTEFEGGRYHGRIIFPSEYPFKPPNLMLLTPNGRFELNKKICLSITGYHPEYWLPAWGVRTVLLGLIGFMTTKSNGAIGGIDYTESERKRLAVNRDDAKQESEGSTNLSANTGTNIPQFSFKYEDKDDKNGIENGDSTSESSLTAKSSSSYDFGNNSVNDSKAGVIDLNTKIDETGTTAITASSSSSCIDL